MTLSLTVAGGAERSVRTLGNGTLSIGRAPGNDWVLADPDRLLSKTHCVIAGAAGRYLLTDLSTNGVFLNGSGERVPRGGQAPLNDGDEFRIGDYVISVAEVADTRAAHVAAVTPGMRTADPLAGAGVATPDPLGGDPLDDPFGAPAPSGFQHPLTARPAAMRPLQDPFDLAESAKPRAADPDDDLFAGIKPAESWQGPSQADDVAAPMHAFRAPPPVNPNEIDFDALLGDLPPGEPMSPPAAAPMPVPIVPAPRPAVAAPAMSDPFQEPPAQPAAPPDPVAALAPAAPQAPPSADAAGLMRAFLEGAGVPDLALGNDPQAAMRAAGEVFRAMVEGIRDVLISRAAVKSEFRVEQTMLRVRDNNALKFSVTPEDALAALLQSSRPGYMAPVKATHEAFDDVRAHEMAVMAAVQSALLGLLKRFEPEALEKRLEPGLLGNVLPGARKARMWELFTTTWNAIAHEAEDDFQAVFGREFARAYDAQLRKL